MPIYEYKCQDCGNHLEKMQKITDEPLAECPKCQGKLEKQWSRTGFQFKGTGWYVTDYAGKGSETKTESKSESGAGETAKSSSADSTAGGDGASKPEAKSSATDSSSTT